MEKINRATVFELRFFVKGSPPSRFEVMQHNLFDLGRAGCPENMAEL
jgi:hypothetical protein